MSSLTLYQKNARSGDSGGWGGWTTVSGADLVDHAVRWYVVYSATLTLTGGQHLTGCEVATNFVGRGSTSARTLSCYVYNYDPTGYSSPPSNYIASASTTATFYNSGLFQTFAFSGLDISNSGKLYFWFVDVVSGTSDAQYNYATGNGVTGTPYASGTFTDAALSLSLSSQNVTTGGNQVVTIGNGNGRSVTVRVKYGNTLLHAASTNTGSLTIPVTKAWFTTAGLKYVKNFSVSVTVDEDGTLYESFTVTAGSDMNPSVSAVGLYVVNTGNAATYYPNTCIAGVSKYQLKVSVSLPTNAGVSTVKITYPGGADVLMTRNSTTGLYEGETAVLSTTVAISVTATDERGMSSTITPVTANPIQYTKPVIVIDTTKTYRCNGSGIKESGGAYWRACASATIYASGNLSTNAPLSFTVKIRGGTEINISSGVQTAAQGGSLDAKTNYTLIFTVQDKVSEAVTKEFTLDSITRNVVVRRNSTGTAVGIGTTPQRAEGSSVEMPIAGDFLLGGIPAQAFSVPISNDLDGSSFGKNFLNVDTTDRKAAVNAAAFFVAYPLTGWQNYPSMVTQYWFGYREVLWLDSNHIIVKITDLYSTGFTWYNRYLFGNWSGWVYVPATSV